MANKSGMEEGLFRFLVSVRERKPWAGGPLVAEGNVINEIFAEANPVLSEAVQHCIDTVLIELAPDPAQMEMVTVPASALGMAIAANNCLALIGATASDDQAGRTEAVASFTRALIDTLPLPVDLSLALTYHAILRGTLDSFPIARPEQRQLLGHLIELSPLTAMLNPDIYTHTALYPLAAELLPGWGAHISPAPEELQKAARWLDFAADLLSNPLIARWMRHRWIALPETHMACRNLGLLLEALRRRNRRELLLEFYESYEFFCSVAAPEDDRRTARTWPIIETILKLLCVSGDNQAAINMNRRGNEYFQKFRPLMEIVIAENGVPPDYRVSARFVLAIRPLLNYITENVRQRISLSEVSFNP